MLLRVCISDLDTIGDPVEVLDRIPDAEVVDVPVVVLLEARLRDPLEDAVDVFDDVIDPVDVYDILLVILLLGDNDADAEEVGVLEGLRVTLSDGLAVDDFEAGPERVDVGELVEVLELLIDPVMVLEDVIVFVNAALLVVVFDRIGVTDLMGDEVVVLDTPDERVDVFVDVPVFVLRPENVGIKLARPV